MCSFCAETEAFKIEQVREGEDVYLRCGYDYSPNSKQQLIWRKEDQIIAMVVQGTLFVHDSSYVLRIVQHDRDALKLLQSTILDAGKYTCSVEEQRSVADSAVLYRNSTIVLVYGKFSRFKVT